MTKYKGVKTLEVLEGADNYNQWIVSSLKPFIKSPALEVGAGTGNISEYFLHLKSIVLTDIDPQLVELLRSKFVHKKNVSFESLDISAPLTTIKNKFQTIFAVNVLEHIKKDDQALANIYRMLEPGGSVVLLVPAKKFAYTKLDKSLGHYRRYEKEELIKILKKENFEIQKIEYFNIVGLLSWMVRNIVSRNHTVLKKSYVSVFDSIVPLLRIVEPKKHLPLGISLIVVAKKKKNA